MFVVGCCVYTPCISTDIGRQTPYSIQVRTCVLFLVHTRRERADQIRETTIKNLTASHTAAMTELKSNMVAEVTKAEAQVRVLRVFLAACDSK